MDSTLTLYLIRSRIRARTLNDAGWIYRKHWMIINDMIETVEQDLRGKKKQQQKQQQK